MWWARSNTKANLVALQAIHWGSSQKLHFGRRRLPGNSSSIWAPEYRLKGGPEPAWGFPEPEARPLPRDLPTCHPSRQGQSTVTNVVRDRGRWVGPEASETHGTGFRPGAQARGCSRSAEGRQHWVRAGWGMLSIAPVMG